MLALDSANSIANIAAKQQGAKVGAIGDSITAQAILSNSTTNTFQTIGYLSWLRFLSNQQIDLSMSDIYATTGYTTQQMIDAGYHTSAAAAGLDFCIIHAGTNDASSVAFATTTANLTRIYNTVLASGAYVVALCILPRGSPSATQKNFIARINKWIYAQAKANPRIIVVNAGPALQTYSTGEPIAAYFFDSVLHPSSQGAYLIAKIIWAAISSYVKKRDILSNYFYDAYDATNNPAGQLLTNGNLTGTAGTKGTTGGVGTVTGSVADSWTVDANSATSGTCVVACSKVTRTDSIQGVWQQLVYSGTNGTTAGFSYRMSQNPTFANISVGDILDVACEIEVDTGFSNLLGVELRSTFGGASYTSFDMQDVNTTYPVWLDPGAKLTGVLRLGQIVVPAGASSTTLSVGAYFPASVAVSATVRIGRFYMRKITT